MKNSYEVTILNQKFVLKTENDEEHVQKIAALVNDVFADIKDRAQNVSTQNIAILGALNLAEKILLEAEKTRSLIGSWKERLVNL